METRSSGHQTTQTNQDSDKKVTTKSQQSQSTARQNERYPASSINHSLPVVVVVVELDDPVDDLDDVVDFVELLAVDLDDVEDELPDASDEYVQSPQSVPYVQVPSLLIA
ncbi:unnamed protein product [Phytophthora fragariaefolia]|uniref:Unnamed protein product n=1 Tax=Phytophthora fragariaefolia TaxID=1490495 RepID=A0A9W6Y476_9STRA|nr:unnamed protein product [Phytophthora fragariaefolia]